MSRNKLKIAKKALCLIFAFLFSIESFAAAVSDNDGSAFITKSEFDSLKNDFQSQIDQYNTTIDSKIDNAIGSYLAGTTISARINLVNNYTKINNTKTLRWTSNNSFSLVPTYSGPLRFIEHKEVFPNGSVTWTGRVTKAWRRAIGNGWSYENIYSCTHDKAKSGVVYVSAQKEMEPLFSEWSFYKFGVFGGYTSATQTQMQMAGRTPMPRWDRINLDNPNGENQYQDNGDLDRAASYIPSHMYASGSRRFINNTISYTNNIVREYDYLILAPMSSSNTYYYWEDCHDYPTFATDSWGYNGYIAGTDKPPIDVSVDNNTYTFSGTTNSVNYTYRQINLQPVETWTNTLGVGRASDNIPWLTATVQQKKLRYKLINNVTGEDNEINCGIKLTHADDAGKLSFDISANAAGKLVLYVGKSIISDLGSSTIDGVKRFDISTSPSKISLDVNKDDDVRLVFLPTDTSVEGTLTFLSDLVLEKST